jgi:threonine aldolase
MMEYIDLRSDTVTQPTAEMRRAMAQAEVGDDVFGEDPSVNRLQEIAADRTGKEAALFVPSGTMGNLASLLAWCDRGDEIILGHLAHIFLFEAGGMAALGGIVPHLAPNQPDGTIRIEDLRAAIRADDVHQPPSKLVCLENTHNRCRGAALDEEYTRRVASFVQEQDLVLHLDGARIFNAAVSLGVAAKALAQPVDSLTFCLSKALCAPVGSIICGQRDFIRRAHRMRKQLGGGMRQAGVLAAAGIVAMESMVDRLAQDHQRARRLARALSELPGVEVENNPPQTNIIYFSLTEGAHCSPAELARKLGAGGIKIIPGPRMRLVTHYWIDDAALDRVLREMERILG